MNYRRDEFKSFSEFKRQHWCHQMGLDFSLLSQGLKLSKLAHYTHQQDMQLITASRVKLTCFRNTPCVCSLEVSIRYDVRWRLGQWGGLSWWTRDAWSWSVVRMNVRHEDRFVWLNDGSWHLHEKPSLRTRKLPCTAEHECRSCDSEQQANIKISPLNKCEGTKREARWRWSRVRDSVQEARTPPRKKRTFRPPPRWAKAEEQSGKRGDGEIGSVQQARAQLHRHCSSRYVPCV